MGATLSTMPTSPLIRLASTALLAGALLALASMRAIETERDIVADVRAGENAYIANPGLIIVGAFPTDDRAQISVPIVSRPASALPIVATVQVTGAPDGYVLTRIPLTRSYSRS